MTEYDVVEYPHQPFAQIQPDRLAVLGMLFGMQPQRPSGCRVLELGCGSGGSLIPLADLHPESSFLGIDLAQTAIDQGRMRIDALALRNLRLEQMDLTAFPPEAGQFDYIIAHGLFSWVPEPVRMRVLQICQRHLAPQGIAYISYNAYPGCHIRQMWRDMMLFHTAQFDNRQDKIDQARSVLNLVAHGTKRDDAVHRLAKEEAARRSGLSDASIFHDDLAPVWQPFLFHDFVSLAEGHGMQYLAEATYSDMQPATIGGDAAQVLQALRATDRIRYEQYLDFFRMRRFRRTLLCRQGVALRAEPDSSCMAQFHYAAPIQDVTPQGNALPVGANAWRNDLNGVTATTNNPIGLAALAAIADAWPSTVSFDDLAAVVDDRAMLCQALHAYYASGLLNVHAVARTATRRAGDYPQVWRVARLEAALGSSIPQLHLGRIGIENQAIRSLLRLFDGTRTRTELEAAIGGRDVLDSVLRDMARRALLTS